MILGEFKVEGRDSTPFLYKATLIDTLSNIDS